MTLRALLDDGARFDVEYGGGLSNHLPMTLVALKRLGADDARLAAFASHCARKLRPAPAAMAWPAGDAWASRLGQREAWPAYRGLFSQWLASEGAGDVLRQVLPALLPGCGAAAFHGLIRTAYAVQTAHRQELADGLAYWACRWLDLGPRDGPQRSGRALRPATALKGLAVALSGHGLIFVRMQAAAHDPHFAPAVARLQVDERSLERLARHAAALYASSGDFTALHLLTSAHALRVLMPFVDAPLPALRAYWRAFAAGVAASGVGAAGAAGATSGAGQAPAARDWHDLLPLALASTDEHLIKIVDSCREEERAYGGDAWRRAATRALARG